MKPERFDELKEALRETAAYLRGETEPSRVFFHGTPDVRAMRERQGLSQEQFAEQLRVSVHTLRNWEQGRRVPDGPSRALLEVMEFEPAAVVRALKKSATFAPAQRLQLPGGPGTRVPQRGMVKEQAAAKSRKSRLAKKLAVVA